MGRLLFSGVPCVTMWCPCRAQYIDRYTGRCRGTMHRILVIPFQPKKAYKSMTFEKGTMHRALHMHDFTGHKGTPRDYVLLRSISTLFTDIEPLKGRS